MNYTSPFREDVIRRFALEFRDGLLPTFEEKLRLEQDLGHLVKLILEKKLLDFKASSVWYYGFVQQNKMTSIKQKVDSGLLHPDNIWKER